MIPNEDGARLYLEARKAIRGAKTPQAYLHLGNLYAKGIGTQENHVLANYFYEKAFLMGSTEAEAYIEQEYSSGRRSVVQKVVSMLASTESPSPETMAWLKKLVEKERRHKNYGNLSSIREYLPIIYPDYDQEKGYDDILNDHKSVDADICYALCTSDNSSEVNLSLLDNMLKQLFAPILHDFKLWFLVTGHDHPSLLQQTALELYQCLPHLSSSYDAICESHGIKKIKIPQIAHYDLCFKVSMITVLRRQAFRCLLSIRDINPRIQEFLGCLESDEQLLNICEEIDDEDLQLFLISFVELNIDTESYLLDYHAMLQSYRQHDLRPLIQHFNDFLQKMTDIDIVHRVPEYSLDNPPKIAL